MLSYTHKKKTFLYTRSHLCTTVHREQWDGEGHLAILPLYTYSFSHIHILAHPFAYILTQMVATGNPVSCKEENVWFLPTEIFSIFNIHLKCYHF